MKAMLQVAVDKGEERPPRLLRRLMNESLAWEGVRPGAALRLLDLGDQQAARRTGPRASSRRPIDLLPPPQLFQECGA